MTQANRDQLVEIITKGADNFFQVTGDKELGMKGIGVFRGVKAAFIENIRAEDICMFAFPSVMVQPNFGLTCYVAILQDRVIVAWYKGLFRTKVESRIIRKSAIKQASWSVSNRPGARGAALLTITSDETTEIALPKGQPSAADAIVAAIQAS